ncbi:MAG: Permease of the major facilitator superfamily, mdtH subfamily [Firmicutes bacterium]|nr:Permease of the major facilitator superfamily, mdtH subfamily [Bacillota bacterium]
MMATTNDDAARRSIWVIIFGLFMIAVGTSLVVPFFTIYLREKLGLTAMQIGMALTAKLVSSYGLTMVGGILSDRYGARATMTVGLLIRAFSYVGIATATGLGSVVAWSVVMGIGGALYLPASKTAMATLAGNQEKVKLFSMRNTANNLGVSIGPLLGVLALFGNARLLFYVAALTYVLFAFLTMFLVSPSPGERAVKARPLNWRIFTWLAFDVRMLYLEFIIGFFMFLYVQMELTMPLHAKTHFGNWAVSLLFTVNAVTVVCLQVPLSTFLSRRLAASVTVTLGLIGMALGLLLMALSHTLPVFLVAIVIFTMGEVTIDPRVDAETSDMVPPGTIGTALGILGAMNAVGGTLGNIVGGAIYSRAADAGTAGDYWIWLGVAAVVGAVLVLIVGSLLEAPVEESQ